MYDSLKIIVKTHTATRTELHEALGKAAFRAVLDRALTAALNEALDLQRGERLRVPAEFNCYYFRIDPAIAAPDPLPDLLAALERIEEILTVPDLGEDEQAYIVFALEAVDIAREQARAARAGARGAEGAE